MADNEKVEHAHAQEPENTNTQKFLAADFIFSSIMAILVLMFFIEALSFHPVARRAPLVVLIPLMLVLVVHLIRLIRATTLTTVKEYFGKVIKGKEENYKKILEIVGWMFVLIGSIYVVGHYAGVAVFLFIMLKIISKETWKTTLILMVVVPLGIYILFEIVLGLQLYRGLLYMIWRGYDVF